MPTRSQLFFVLLAGFCSLASASSCPEFFALGHAPVPQTPKLLVKFQELCNKGYAVGYSGLTRTPLWSAEVITKVHVSEQKGVRRENTFHVDERIAASERAELSDYLASGFDRGHMTPSASLGHTSCRTRHLVSPT